MVPAGVPTVVPSGIPPGIPSVIPTGVPSAILPLLSSLSGDFPGFFFIWKSLKLLFLGFLEKLLVKFFIIFFSGIPPEVFHGNTHVVPSMFSADFSGFFKKYLHVIPPKYLEIPPEIQTFFLKFLFGLLRTYLWSSSKSFFWSAFFS